MNIQIEERWLDISITFSKLNHQKRGSKVIENASFKKYKNESWKSIPRILQVDLDGNVNASENIDVK